MWSLRTKSDSSFYLTYDKFRRFDNNLRGLWEFVGSQESLDTARLVKMNQQTGLLCCNDDEGNVRALVLTEEVQNA